MARGAQKTAENNANTGYQNAQTYNTQLENQNQEQNNYLQTQYQNILANPGYTPAQQAALTLNSTGSESAAFGSAADQAARTAAKTGNSANLASQQDHLAQEKAQTMASTNAANQVTIANDAQQQQQALQGLNSMYGTNTNLLAKSLGVPPEYLSAYNQAMDKPSATQSILQSLLGAGGQVGAAALGGGKSGCWVAAELYGGWFAPETISIREWLGKTWWMRPFSLFYGKFGQRWAEWIRRNRSARRVTKRLFDEFVRQAHV